MAGGLSRALAEFAATFPCVRIPETALDAAARSLLDTAACALAGLAERSSQMVLDMMGREAAAGPCTAVGLARPVGPREAALINGCLAHALDFDDTHDRAVLHPGAAVIPAALAAAESVGASGLALLDAIVIGYDVHVRVALAATRAPGITGWHYTSACGIFGATAAAGRLFGLDAGQMSSALGLASSQASGTLQSEEDGSWSKRLQPGLAASGGILSARLAGRGFQGPQESLEGRFGFYRVYLREFDRAPVLDGLGDRFEVERTSLKPFPTCRFTHAPAAALQDLLRGQAVHPSDILRIEARITGPAFAEVCEPLADKVRPRNAVLAQFSLPYVLACVASHGTVTLADLTEEAIRREEVLALAERVLCVRDPALEAQWGERIGEAEVRLVRRDGAVVAGRALPPGCPERPMTDQDLHAKVEHCLAWGAPGREAAQLTKAVDALRYSKGVSALSGCLGPSRSSQKPT